MIEVSYSEARARLAELLDRVTDDHDVVRIRRQGNKPGAVLIDADDYTSLEETAYLLSSPANAQHILRAVVELEAGRGREYAAVDDLWRELEVGRPAEDAPAIEVGKPLPAISAEVASEASAKRPAARRPIRRRRPPAERQSGKA